VLRCRVRRHLSPLGEPTEQRLIIGWIHVDAFYLCAGHSGDEEEIKRAEPRD
jgi:hypothetical protein